jgi:hypothetical protein
MNIRNVLAPMLSAVALLAACSTAKPPPGVPAGSAGPYASTELAGLDSCSDDAVTVLSVAQGKAAGESRDKIAGQFRRGSPADRVDAQLAIIDKVYAEPATPPLEYAKQFFTRCAADVAKVAPNRISPARSCFVDRTVAIRAAALRIQGKERSEAIAVIAPPGVNAGPVVSRAYFGRGTPNHAGVIEWQACMRDLAGH